MIPNNLNVGFIDRLVRGLLAIDLLALWLAGFLIGPPVTLALLIATYAAITGVLGSCFIYSLLGINTRQRTEP
ncbi:DUF2892 domain-containing protein [Fibrella sp. HMF5335]|uniref:DUF2892 domain-containing protein n=1 Tax=Fibrella rubiginis TaxID=2817060 RepID=A0A939GKL2_9BACT|nr:DUF2892 domain-containing protein [Fibrella rubiginis]MBO0939140.1 DUF2892 domain-containing protein [Fibrella rubiginis]